MNSKKKVKNNEILDCSWGKYRKVNFVVGKQLLEFSKEIQIYDTSIDR